MDKKMPEIMAVYLPQFHETDDNNKWWGDGFTDWDAVKQAEICFAGQNVPWIPLNNNYYDLSKVETLQWQVDLAKEYGVDCLCFYHYYFKDGKLELETPAELLLQHSEIDIQFCFNWASTSWVRTWSKISGNIWSEKFDVKGEDDSAGVLVEQDYGDRTDWEEHFKYLLPFLKDNRYYRIDEKPVFIFYNPKDILCINDMINTWKKLAVENGLKGMYFIGVNANAKYYNLDASLVYEPRNAINSLNEKAKAISKDGVRCFEYQDVWDAIISQEGYNGVHTFYSGVSGYDDTPRRGKGGECLINRSPQIFEDGLYKLMIKSASCGNEFMLINAWNEWGEGMYLEPDEQDKYAYLEAVKHVKDRMKEKKGIVQDKQKDTNINDIDKETKQFLLEMNKYKNYANLLDRWLYLERKGRFLIEEYLQNLCVYSIAIYGIGVIGKQLYEQIDQTKVKVCYGIDRYVGQYGENFEIYRPEDEDWPEVDAIVIAVYDEGMSILDFLREKAKCKIFSLENIVNDIWKQE